MALYNNSYKDKDKQERPEQKLQAVGKGHKMKTGITDKVRNDISERLGSSLSDYVVNDLVMPNLLSLGYEIIEGVASLIFLKERGRGLSKGNGTVRRIVGTGLNTAYDKVQSASTKKRERANPPNSVGKYSYQIVEIEGDERESARVKAELAMVEIAETLDKYGRVRVLDYYDICGVDPSSTCDADFGWTDISDMRIQPSRNGRYAVIMSDKVESLK